MRNTTYCQKISLLSVIQILLAACLPQIMNGQITFEHSYPVAGSDYRSLFLTNLGNNNYKYILQECTDDRFKIYNLDHSLYMNVEIPYYTESCLRVAVGYVTTTLFDCDSTT